MKKKVSVIGGDLRQLTVAQRLAEDGYDVQLFGFENSPTDTALLQAANCQEAAHREIIVLPIPLTTDRKTINAPFSAQPVAIDTLLQAAEPGTILFAGKPPAMVTEWCREKNIRLYDYFEREELAVKNAISTAEGALEIAIAETPETIYGSRCLVVGYGRIGKVLSKMLQALGAEVSVSARKYADLAWIETNGYIPLRTDSLADSIGTYNIIFNTVPAVVLDRRVLSGVNPDALIVDLASKPGGVDFSIAKELGLQVIWALSLPGKTAPISAGEIIKEAIVNILQETEV